VASGEPGADVAGGLGSDRQVASRRILSAPPVGQRSGQLSSTPVIAPWARMGSVGGMAETTWLDATAQADLVRRGELSPKELVEAAIARIEAVNPRLDAVIWTRFDAARQEAEGDLPHGPFRGVPILSWAGSPLPGPSRRRNGSSASSPTQRSST
jgi:hypothetical protein